MYKAEHSVLLGSSAGMVYALGFRGESAVTCSGVCQTLSVLSAGDYSLRSFAPGISGDICRLSGFGAKKPLHS